MESMDLPATLNRTNVDSLEYVVPLLQYLVYALCQISIFLLLVLMQNT